MSGFYPIFLRVKNKRCVVVGGGDVAGRKARSLLEHEANVEVVSADVCPELAQLATEGRIHHCRRRYRQGDLAGAVLAIAATDDPAINAEVAEEGRGRNIPVNVVDSPDLSDFIVPSLLRRGDLSIAVSTAGKTPALARKLRSELEKVYGPGYGLLVELAADVRQELKRDGLAIDAEVWHRSLELELLVDLLNRGLVDQARERLLRRLRSG